jgi:hypothetical protein
VLQGGPYSLPEDLGKTASFVCPPGRGLLDLRPNDRHLTARLSVADIDG